MRKEEVKKVDENLAAEIAVREGIKAVLACSIGKIGDEYILTARMLDPGTQSVVFSQVLRAAGKDHILGGLDELAKKLRRELGESLAKISRQKMPMMRATTSSLEALKYFTQAKVAPWDTAVKLLQQAIDLDPDFAMAHADLGMKYYFNNERKKGEEHFEKALNLLDRLTTREKLWIQALVEDWRGNREQGIENYKAYVAQYPDDHSAWFRLGYAYMITNRNELGIEAFKKVIELNSFSSSAYINLATIYGRLGKDDEALANYEKAFELLPGYAVDGIVNNEYGFTLIRKGRIEDAERAFEKMLQQSELAKKEKGHRSLALLNIYLGKCSTAQEHLEEAIRFAIASKLPLSELRDRLYLARLSLMQSKNAIFEEEMKAVRKIQGASKFDPFYVYLIGRAYTRAGRVKEAEQQVDILKSSLGDVLALSNLGRSNRGDQAYFYMLKGEVEVVQKRYGEAINSFNMAASLGDLLVNESLGYAFGKTGDLNKAAAKYQEFLQNHHLLGTESLESWILAHFELAKIFEQNGQPEEAVKYYERFLEIWENGDPDLPVFLDAKKRLAKLRAAPQSPSIR
jgi:tetratricopeptide (TPR) repeat protein